MASTVGSKQLLMGEAPFADLLVSWPENTTVLLVVEEQKSETNCQLIWTKDELF